LESVFESSADGILAFDRECRYILWNPAMERLSGVPRERVVGRRAFDVFPFLEEIGEDRSFGAALRGETVKTADRPFRVPETGREGYFEGHYSPLHGAGGEVVGGLGIIREVTERKDIEDEVRRLNMDLERRVGEFQALLDLLPIGIGVARDPECRVVTPNRYFSDLLGMPHGEDVSVRGPGARALPFKFLRDGADLPLDELPMRRAAVEGRTVSGVECDVLRADGTLAHLYGSAAPVFDEEGRVRGALGAYADITELKRLQASLHGSEERLRLALTAARMGTWEWNIRTGEVSWSESLEPIHGMPPGAFGGTFDAFLECVHPDDRPHVTSVVSRTVEQGGDYDIEFRIVWPDGTVHWIQGLGHTFAGADGRPERLVGLAIDITQRKQADELRAELLARQQEAREVAEAAGERLRMLQRVTEAALSHLSLDDLIDDLHRRIGEVLEADTVTILLLEGDALVARAARGLEEEVERGVRIPLGQGFAGRVAAEGRPVVVNDIDEAAVVNPILRERGVRSLLGVPLTVEESLIGVLHVGSFESLRFSEEDAVLLQLIADRIALAIFHARLYAAERAARAQAEEASRLKDEFLAMVSHELRTPLNSMLGWVRLLRAGRVDEATAARGLEIVERNVVSQAQLIEDLLDVSRIVTGRLRLEVRPVELDAVVEAAVDSVKLAAEAKKIRLQVIADSAAGPVLGDPERLQQVVWNLLSNAIKFTPKGGRIQVRLARVDSHAEITVGDSGQGIAPEFLPYVFDRFRQADSSITRTHRGLGLGLAIVKHITELHGGTVRAASPGEGQGATFVVRLPLTAVLREAQAEERRANASSGPAFTRPPSLDGMRVLVVDDERDTREMLRTLFEDCQAEVLTVGTAREALEAVDRWRPDVLVSDIGMPGEDGYALIERVRQRSPERGGDIPAVALTAYARSEDRMRSLAAGFQMHVAKPVEPAELVMVVASLVNLRRKR
jgi:PAS domain S-box-containing protein